MPKILPTFTAIAIIGVCIAFNTMRYPIVWEMVGPKGSSSLAEKTMASATPTDADRPAKAETKPASTGNLPETAGTPPAKAVAETATDSMPLAVAPTAVTTPLPSPQEKTSEAESLPLAVGNAPKSESPLPLKAVPITVPVEARATDDAGHAAEKSENTENHTSSPTEEDLVEPPRRLVPVANEFAAATSQGTLANEIRRLPPIETPAGALDYAAAPSPNTAFPIYPSTGK